MEMCTQRSPIPTRFLGSKSLRFSDNTSSTSHLINTCTVPATLTLGSRRDQTCATLNVKDMVIASDYKLRLLVI